MQTEHYMIFSLITLMLVFFIWGKWRYDVVAMATLLIASFVGLVPIDNAFEGFSNPAVITVAAVLVVSKGLTNAGVVDFIAKHLLKTGDNTMVQMTLLVLTVTIGSAFMNNIGALALMMPVALKLSRKNNKSPSIFLMPLAFGSLLGGMMTLIGTPPNIIISMYRAESTGSSAFGMFDFLPVGGGVALAGVLFILLLGWRLIPKRTGGKSAEDLFEIKDYITEVLVPEDSQYIEKTVSELESTIEGDLKVVAVYRNDKTFAAPSLSLKFKSNDSVVIESAAQEFQELLAATDLVLAETSKLSQADISSDEIEIIETVVMTNSFLIGRSARSMKFRSRYGINILGVAREGVRIKNTPDTISFRIGDILLLQGNPDTINDLISQWGCLPLAGRGLTLGKTKKLLPGIGMFAAAIALTAFGIIPVQIAFISVAVLMVVGKFLSLREVYESIDWSIIILLGAIIPVSKALETTGGAQLIAQNILGIADKIPLWASIAVVLTVSMTLSDIVNNAAAVLIMAPIAVEIASGLSVSPDSFLMSVAIGASCSFLTPIGHQSNTLIMGPGGYKFGDYWKMGLPLEIIVVCVATPLIMLTWL
ncbi:SLC13 family permease [Acidaminobacter hydrogenoformans]|uniref:Di-and tricarboxylate transporter n=1 Tax=Acidaminobacter hydrogenoformans DSM 2784 TaxID=1120920 RepID=A0A1G5S3G7_9FIRM|nr:SLC13 family permease [Acidaminobacter hydrogenoformans]SCZ80915.1 Di-and tricarboxylate transporter [Acidaminobacter hydrogenoformans DSM 2784]